MPIAHPDRTNFHKIVFGPPLQSMTSLETRSRFDIFVMSTLLVLVFVAELFISRLTEIFLQPFPIASKYHRLNGSIIDSMAV